MSNIEAAGYFEEMYPNICAGAVAMAKTMEITGIPYGGQDDGSVIEKKEVDQVRAELPA